MDQETLFEDRPDWVFIGRRSFADPLVGQGVFVETSFHDEELFDSQLTQTGVNILIGEVWFGRYLDYDAFETNGVESRLVFATHPPDHDMIRIWSMSERCVYNIEFDPATGWMEFQVYDIYDLRFRIDPARSTFEWLFRPLPATEPSA